MSIIIFALLFIVGTGLFTYNILQIRSNILLGKSINRSDNSSERWKTMILVALGQKKMFTRPIPALLHLAIYVAFIITQIELIEIVADGLSGSHRVFREALGGFYTFMISFIEILSFAALVATIAFLSRRNLLKLPRLNMKELAGWPAKDANLILIMEIVLVSCIFTMNGTDEVLLSIKSNEALSYGFAISSWMGPAIFGGMSEHTLHILEQVGWWGHILM
ncbi:MAG: Fe-S oxidoreductase, partial [Flavobacteriia bacterium]